MTASRPRPRGGWGPDRGPVGAGSMAWLGVRSMAAAAVRGGVKLHMAVGHTRTVFFDLGTTTRDLNLDHLGLIFCAPQLYMFRASPTDTPNKARVEKDAYIAAIKNSSPAEAVK